jgi:hypothetical protein
MSFFASVKNPSRLMLLKTLRVGIAVRSSCWVLGAACWVLVQ